MDPTLNDEATSDSVDTPKKRKKVDIFMRSHCHYLKSKNIVDWLKIIHYIFKTFNDGLARVQHSTKYVLSPVISSPA